MYWHAHYCLIEGEIHKVHYFVFFNYRYHYQYYSAHRLHIKVIRQLSLYILKTGIHSHLQKCITHKKNEMMESRKWKRPLTTLHRHQVRISCFPIRFAIISILTPHLHFPMKITRSTSKAHLIIPAGSGLPFEWSVCMAPPLTLQSFSGCFCPSYFPCGFFFFLQFSHFSNSGCSLYSRGIQELQEFIFVRVFSQDCKEKKKRRGRSYLATVSHQSVCGSTSRH